MKTNAKKRPIHTHEGGKSSRCNAEQQLRRSVMACMLWENTFYEDGTSIATRIEEGVKAVPSDVVCKIAVEARTAMKLRHAPLWLCAALAKNNGLTADTLAQVIDRADELTEFLAMYWKDGKHPISAQVKKGLAQAFCKFDAYQLAKYNRKDAVKLVDVMFMCHPKPKDKEQAETWKALVDKTLQAPDTWEVNLSTGKNKKETWERMLKEDKLGGLALIRNLRNMREAGTGATIIRHGLNRMKVDRILPFRFIAAAKHAPEWEAELEQAFFRSLEGMSKLKGHTIVLVDVSGSMDGPLSSKSELTCKDAACGVAMCAKEMCEQTSVYTFSEHTVQVPARRGNALRDAIVGSQYHSCTYLGRSLQALAKETYDRIIVITDEQSHDSIPAPKGKGYIINVASYQNGVGYGRWTKIDGFSEAVMKYLVEYENAL